MSDCEVQDRRGARGPAQLAKGELLNGSGKGRGRDSKSTNAVQASEPSRNKRRCFNEVVKDLPLVFLNPSVVAAQDNRTAATGCLTIEFAGAASELEWKLICLASAYEHWSDAFDGPHDTGTTGNLHYETENRLVWTERERRKEERELVYISISERPAEVGGSRHTGSLGGRSDGSRNSHIATLVERHSRFSALVKVPSKDTAVVVAALSRQIRNSHPRCGAL